MAGTDRSRSGEVAAGEAPAIILVNPQLGENIGATARAMLNCGLLELRLVKPRDGWPNPTAEAMASGAIEVLEGAKLYDTIQEAIGDLDFVLATTARSRDQVKDAYTPKGAVAKLRWHIAAGGRAGILFGPERAGLLNDDVALADAIVHVPLNPAFASLNLAQAVLILGYEWFQSGDETPDETLVGTVIPASHEEREFFFTRLERELEEAGFLFPPHLVPTIRRNLRNMFTRARLTDQDVRTLHGVVTALVKKQGKRSSKD